MKNQILILSSMLALAACNGPWNMMPSDEKGGDPELQLSLFAVGGRDFDTLWLERTQPLAADYDSTRVFVEEATMLVSRSGDPSDSVSYQPMPGSGVAWVPVRSHKVVAGATYEFRASVLWNAARDWPTGKELRRSELTASATVPSEWSVSDSVLAPLEALVPSLSVGYPIGDSAWYAKELDSLLPGRAQRYRITSATLDSLRQGVAVMRRIRSGDSVLYISGATRVVKNSAGQDVLLPYRDYMLHTRFGDGFGGAFAVQKFDPSRAFIQNILQIQFRQSRGKKGYDSEDSARLFQPGNTRYYFGPMPAAASEMAGWPNVFLFSNLGIGYTGMNTLYVYATDPSYYNYNVSLQGVADGDRTTILYSNVKGAKGYFTGALVDSFSINVFALASDTFPVQQLRGAACRQAWKQHVQDGEPFDSTFCEGVQYKPKN